MKDNHYFTIKKIFYITCIISIVVSLWFKVVKAEEMSDNLKEWCTEYMNTYIRDFPNEDLQLAFSECPYFSAYSFYTRNGQYKIYVIDFYNQSHVGMTWSNDQWWDSSFTSYYGGIVRKWYNCNILTDLRGNIEKNFVGYRFTSDESTRFYGSCKLISNTTNIQHLEYNGGFDNYMVEGTNEGTILHGTTNNWTSNSNPGFEYYGSYGDVYLAINGRQGRHYDNSIEPISNSTDGLRVYKQTIHNQSYLMIDYSDLITYNSTYDYTSSVFGNIDINGLIYEIDYDNTSQYYHAERSTGKIYYQIPFSALTLTDPEIETATLENLEINVSVNNHVETTDYTFYWLDRIYLIGSPHNNNGFSPDSQTKDNPTVINDNSITINNFNDAIYNSLSGDAFYYYPSQAFNSTQNAVNSIKGASTYTFIEGYIVDDDGQIIDGKFPIYVNEDNPHQSGGTLLGQYLYDNAFGLYYDVIIVNVYDFDVQTTPTSYTYDGTIVIYTELYYIKNGINSFTFSLKDIIQYDKLCSDYIYKLYDVTFDKLTSIDYNTSEYFNLTSGYFEEIILTLENINNILPDLKDILNQIFDALQNLHLSQLDSIETKLTSILNSINTDTPFNEDDTIAEAIQYYQTHTQLQAVAEDKYSVWFTGYCHFWLQEYEEQNTRSTSNVNDFTSVKRRTIILKTFNVVKSIYDNMQTDLYFSRVTEFFDYFLNEESDVTHTRRSFFYDIFDETNTPTLDYDPSY